MHTVGQMITGRIALIIARQEANDKVRTSEPEESHHLAGELGGFGQSSRTSDDLDYAEVTRAATQLNDQIFQKYEHLVKRLISGVGQDIFLKEPANMSNHESKKSRSRSAHTSSGEGLSTARGTQRVLTPNLTS